MISSTSGSGTFVAGRVGRWAAILITFFFGSFAVFVPLFRFPESLRPFPVADVQAYLVLVSAAVTSGCIRAWRMGVGFDTNGVTVRNYFRTYKIGWAEVDCLVDGAALGGSLGGESGGMEKRWALSVLTRDGRALTATGTIGASDYEDLAVMKRSAQHYGVATHLTGEPRWRGSRWRGLFTFVIVIAALYAALVWSNANVS